MTTNNFLKKSNKSTRKELFSKLAKKDNDLSGKLNRKNIEKILSKLTDEYNNLKLSLDNAKNDKAQLEKIIDENSELLNDRRKKIMNCHDYLKNMDFSGAKELKIDNDDVAYVYDGKLYHYDLETGEKKPYIKWKKEQKLLKEQSESSLVDTPDKNDAKNLNDFDSLDPDGIDITI